MNKEIIIDAAGRALGRVASEVAVALRGKLSPSFTRHELPPVRVRVVNAGQLSIRPAKLKSDTLKRYSGYPGGLKQPSLGEVIAKKGVAEPLRRAIKGMLPANKLRPKLLAKLKIID